MYFNSNSFLVFILWIVKHFVTSVSERFRINKLYFLSCDPQALSVFSTDTVFYQQGAMNLGICRVTKEPPVGGKEDTWRSKGDSQDETPELRHSLYAKLG